MHHQVKSQDRRMVGTTTKSLVANKKRGQLTAKDIILALLLFQLSIILLDNAAERYLNHDAAIVISSNSDFQSLPSTPAVGSEIRQQSQLFDGIWATLNGNMARLLTMIKFIHYADCLRLIKLEVPKEIKQGQLAPLRCLYELENNKLQSLVWYKNGREFYRYQPYDRRSVLIFNRTGVHVDLARSRNQTIVLTNTTLETSGRYRCEITANDFQTDNMEIFMAVIVANSASSTLDIRFGYTTIVSYCLISFSVLMSYYYTLHNIKLDIFGTL